MSNVEGAAEPVMSLFMTLSMLLLFFIHIYVVNILFVVIIAVVLVVINFITILIIRPEVWIPQRSESKRQQERLRVGTKSMVNNYIYFYDHYKTPEKPRAALKTLLGLSDKLIN